jgi:hypothetical protein
LFSLSSSHIHNHHKSQCVVSLSNSINKKLTEISGEDTEMVIVTTQMVSAFFSDLGTDVTDAIDIVATVMMEFVSASGERTRKFVRIGGTHQKNDNVSDMGHKLDQKWMLEMLVWAALLR